MPYASLNTDAPRPPTLSIISPTPRAFTFPKFHNLADSPYLPPPHAPYQPIFPAVIQTPLYSKSPVVSPASSPTHKRRTSSASLDVERRPKKGDEDYIKRPENAFILFRRKCCEERVAVEGIVQKQRQADLSKTISQQWKGLSAEERQHWEQLAKQRRKEHEQRYPNYVYRPQRQHDKDGKVKKCRGRFDTESVTFILPETTRPILPKRRRADTRLSTSTTPLMMEKRSYPCTLWKPRSRSPLFDTNDPQLRYVIRRHLQRPKRGRKKHSLLHLNLGGGRHIPFHPEKNWLSSHILDQLITSNPSWVPNRAGDKWLLTQSPAYPPCSRGSKLVDPSGRGADIDPSRRNTDDCQGTGRENEQGNGQSSRDHRTVGSQSDGNEGTPPGSSRSDNESNQSGANHGGHSSGNEGNPPGEYGQRGGDEGGHSGSNDGTTGGSSGGDEGDQGNNGRSNRIADEPSDDQSEDSSHRSQRSNNIDDDVGDSLDTSPALNSFSSANSNAPTTHSPDPSDSTTSTGMLVPTSTDASDANSTPDSSLSLAGNNGAIPLQALGHSGSGTSATDIRQQGDQPNDQGGGRENGGDLDPGGRGTSRQSVSDQGSRWLLNFVNFLMFGLPADYHNSLARSLSPTLADFVKPIVKTWLGRLPAVIFLFGTASIGTALNHSFLPTVFFTLALSSSIISFVHISAMSQLLNGMGESFLSQLQQAPANASDWFILSLPLAALNWAIICFVIGLSLLIVIDGGIAVPPSQTAALSSPIRLVFVLATALGTLPLTFSILKWRRFRCQRDN